jgi:hypothetical protein
VVKEILKLAPHPPQHSAHSSTSLIEEVSAYLPSPFLPSDNGEADSRSTLKPTTPMLPCSSPFLKRTGRRSPRVSPLDSSMEGKRVWISMPPSLLPTHSITILTAQVPRLCPTGIQRLYPTEGRRQQTARRPLC